MAHDRNQEAQVLIDQIPEGSEFDPIRHIVHATYENEPDTIDDFFDNRILGFVREIQTGQNPNRPEAEGRSVEEIAREYWEVQLPALRGESPARTGGQEGQSGGQTDADPSTLPGVLAGGRTVSVGGERLYQVYEFPQGSGNFVAYQFNNREQAEQVLGRNFPFENRRESWFERRVLAEAPAEEVIGLEGSFIRLSDEIMGDAARAAGVRDPSLAGQLASDPEMQQIMAQAVVGEWSPEQIRAEQRKTDFWKNELYPGIEKLYDRTSQPERAWVEYRSQVSPALKTLGYEPGPDGTFKNQIQTMLENEIDSETFLQQVPTFIRATQNVEFAGVLNQWAETELGRDIDFNDWFDLMAGESAPEVEAVAEKAQLAFAAQQQGTQVSRNQIRSLADRSELSPAEMQRTFGEFAQGILATDGFRRSAITQDEVLSALAGVNPGSGRTIEEVRLEVAKLAREEDLFDEEKINFFVGFDESGRPNRPGLQTLAPEGA